MEVSAYFERYQKIVSIEQRKNNLIEELLQRVTDLEEVFSREKLDHEREMRFNRDIQIHEIELMDKLSRVKTIMDREPFVVVLLDGDGMIFKDEFLQQGGQGGRNAASQLSSALRAYVEDNFPGISAPKIMTKIYANMKGLSEICTRGHIINEQSALDDFVRGFNGSMPLLDLVDTGKGKPYDKIRGCSPEVGYSEKLEDILADRDLIGRVSLIEGIAFDKDLELLKPSYRVTNFPDIFRTTKITPALAPYKAAITAKPRSLFTPSPIQHTVPLSRTSTNTTLASNSTPITVPISSTNSANTPSTDEFQVVRPKATNLTRPKTVERNRHGQRVDRLDFKSIPREDLNRLKKLKLCNFYYLQGECPNENCHHDHTRKLSKNDYFILSAIARMTPCRFGLECEDAECMYGHRCPQSEPGKKNCYWGSSCRFEPETHGIDTTIVKLTKV
ncbi:CCCH zinc finger protein [Aspergillus ruber CBS 135680]|uniref:C-x8-C-x5-C-x3-H zinc finger protein n=1 Tax=Aspergillus ruber (strain CBS 135680) TaxID=1388766 RepID=A0A017SI46_ASPRC|nr:C-x8-C-x5-C-x3-H zinc finger protein [Aspergillus ruber CBS 135680]EYE96598.1 C-x8-C-x5-C-x3-H zinc finger protein [Aspergillus ruber CBS 135680]